MVTRQWSEVTRPSDDCQTTFFRRFKQLETIWKKVTERSRDSGRRSRDRQPTVKQRFLYVSSNLKIFRKKSLNGHATVIGGHATVGRLSNNVFGRFKQFEFLWKKSRNGHATVVGGHATVGWLSSTLYAWIRERKREGERDYLRYTSYGHRHVCAVGRFISRRPGWG